MNKKVFSIALALLIIFSLTTSSLGEENIESKDLYNILPQGEGYQWNYQGFTEYGHTMIISSISEDETEYSISGELHDMSGMKSDEELSFNMKYVLEGNTLIQYNGTKIQDSDFARIELIKAPLEQGNTWTQELTRENGEAVSLRSEIVSVNSENGETTYTVNYEAIDGDYYEIRRIKEGVGVIYFEKPIISNGTEITMNYSLNEDMSGYISFNEFKDLDSNAWYAEYVNNLIKKGIIDGYPDDTFKPQNNINVAEFTKLLLNSLGYEESHGSDVWYSNYIERAKQLNIIDDDDFINYDRAINRQEMAKMIVRAIGEEGTNSSTQFDDDSNIEIKYTGYVEAAVSLDMLQGYPDNTFRPDQHLTRAEASKVIVEVMNKYVDEDSKSEENGLSKEKIFSLEQDFKEYLFQETDFSNVVLNYDSKAGLIADMQRVTSENLATEYVNVYFEEENGDLSIIPTEGPAMLVDSKPLTIKQIAEGEYLITQENENELRGRYRLEIYYKNIADRGWIMTNRIFYPINANGDVEISVDYKIIDKSYSEDVAASVEHIKSLRGYGIINETPDSYIVYIGLGEKSTGGYGLSVYSCVDLVTNTTKIVIKEDTPNSGDFVTQAITYPYILLEVDKINSNIEVETMDGEKLEDINDESGEAQ